MAYRQNTVAKMKDQNTYIYNSMMTGCKHRTVKIINMKKSENVYML